MVSSLAALPEEHLQLLVGVDDVLQDRRNMYLILPDYDWKHGSEFHHLIIAEVKKSVPG